MKIKYLILVCFLFGSQVFAIPLTIINKTQDINLSIVTQRTESGYYKWSEIKPGQKITMDNIFLQKNGKKNDGLKFQTKYEILVGFNNSDFYPMEISGNPILIFNSNITNNTTFVFSEDENQIILNKYGEKEEKVEVSTFKKSLIQELKNPTKISESKNQEKDQNNQTTSFLTSKKVISAFGAAAVAGFVVFLISKYNNEPKKEKE